ncbi:MAG: DUF4082 domain-containing protein, partial [Patescibacteria group bacterium]
MHCRQGQAGQSLIELLVAMAIFVLVVSSIMFLTLDSQSANRQGGERTAAVQHARGGLEASLGIQRQGWKYLTPGTYGLSDVSGRWQLTGSEDTLGTYRRTVTISPVSRDVGGAITTGGGTVDLDTKLVTSRVTWSFTPLRPSEVVQREYVTNWRSRTWVQTGLADFDAGTKNQVVSTNTAGGELQLAQASGGTFGNRFTVETAVVDVLHMTANTHRTSMRFTAQTTGHVSELRVYLEVEQGASPAYTYGLQTEVGGKPSGTWLGSLSIAYSSTGWKLITLPSPVSITAGTVYYLVVQAPASGAQSNRYISLRATSRQNLLVPLTGADDLQSNVFTSTDGGVSWNPINQQPLFVLGFNTVPAATYEGNPYQIMDDATYEIYGTRYVGERFVQGSNVSVTGVTVEARKETSGTPAGPIIATLWDVTNNTALRSATIAASMFTDALYAARIFTFSSAVDLVAGNTYRLYFSATGAVSSNAYRVRRLDVVDSAMYRGITYGGEVNALYSTTTNGGSSWTDMWQY